MPQLPVDFRSGPEVRFDLVGVGNATVFTGLCAEHDGSIFKPLDEHPGRPITPETLFLMAYRAVLRGAHVCNHGATKAQHAYEKLVAIGKVDRETASEPGLLALHQMLNAWRVWEYKTSLDDALRTRMFDVLKFDTLRLRATGPCVAVAALITLPDVVVKGRLAFVILNVIPTDDGDTRAYLAYLGHDVRPARRVLRPLLSAHGIRAQLLLSKLILERSENWILNPDHFGKFSELKRNAIVSFFAETMLEPKDTMTSALNLFAAD